MVGNMKSAVNETFDIKKQEEMLSRHKQVPKHQEAPSHAVTEESVLFSLPTSLNIYWGIAMSHRDPWVLY